MSDYRKNNFIASQVRRTSHIVVHPHLLYGLRQIARNERKSVSWLVEKALSDYFGVEVMLKKLKNEPKPSYDQVKTFRSKRRKSVA